MQHAQIQQHKGASGNGRVPHPPRHSDIQMMSNAVAQSDRIRRSQLHSVKRPFQKHTDTQFRILADGNTARGGATGLGAFYEAQEEAARRISQRLHDDSAQMLATVYLELADIARDCPDSTVLKIGQVVKHLDGVREQLRDLSHELSPPILDQLGLIPALQSLANGVGDRSGVNMVVSGVIAKLPRLVSAVLYRVVQEALSNVVRHAQATQAVVRVSIGDNKVLCTVSDDGIGLKARGEHQQDVVIGTVHGPVYGLGLTGIHDRITALNGRCKIASRRHGGTKLTVEIPL